MASSPDNGNSKADVHQKPDNSLVNAYATGLLSIDSLGTISTIQINLGIASILIQVRQLATYFMED